jgi:Dolichyl-phosphate-mannose-protein mannosyltransferase
VSALYPGYRRDALIVAVLALIVGTIMAAALHQPGYTDAYYYFNAGQRLVQGKGLTDAALWTYIGAPVSLPAPSHLYWMPLASLIAAAGMAILGPTFHAAQFFFVPMYAGVVVVGFTLGALLGGTRRTAWLSAILTLCSSFFVPYWTTTSTFAPFALTGSLALLSMGFGRRSGNWRWFALSGAAAAAAHLTRADGVLLLGVMVVVILWPRFAGHRWQALAAGLIAYTLIMAPWFARNLNIVGTILPPGGLQTAWMRSYDEIANYPPGISLQDFIAWGPGNIIQSRWVALQQNFGRFVAEQGMVVLTPFMLIGLWRRRRDPLLGGFGLYALGLHFVMTFVFAFPGWRGGLFHSASALVPFWAALGVVGLDDVIAWLAQRRRWRRTQAQKFFGTALAAWAVAFSLTIFIGKVPDLNGEGNYSAIAQHLPADATVIINDPSAMYYFTGISGVVVPNAPPSILPALQAQYGTRYLVLDQNRTAPMNDLYEGREPPSFLEQIYRDDRFQIYHIK